MWAYQLSNEEIKRYFPSGEFIGAWNYPIVIETGDYLAVPHPDENEVYRIKASEFAQSYGREGRRRSSVNQYNVGDLDKRITRQAARFKSSVGQVEPWSLSSEMLATYLTEAFVNSSHLPSGWEREKRVQLVERLTGTSGLGLLESCCSSDTRPPWVKLTHTPIGDPLEDETRAQQLTSFLHDTAGLSFYFQLYVSCATMSPLQGYEFVNHVQIKKEHYEVRFLHRSVMIPPSSS